MNKEYVLNKINEELNLSEDKLAILDSILDENSLIGKTNKEKMINEFVSKLDVTTEEAEKYYETVSKVIMTAIKHKITHPFGSDKKNS